MMEHNHFELCHIYFSCPVVVCFFLFPSLVMFMQAISVTQHGKKKKAVPLTLILFWPWRTQSGTCFEHLAGNEVNPKPSDEPKWI